MRHILLLFIVTISLSACNEPSSTPENVHGEWRALLSLNDSIDLPFNFTWDGTSMVIKNGEERITATDVRLEGDTTVINMPVFQSGFRFVDKGNKWIGFFTKYDSETPYWIPFYAEYGEADRFTKSSTEVSSLPARWEVELRTGTDNPKPAIGEFYLKDDGTVTGTFMTETGDYRFLEGAFNGNEMLLSGFDGNHTYLFNAVLSNNTLHGMHYSGLTYAQPWKAVPNDSIQLRDPSELTYLKEGETKITFEAPNVNTGEVFHFSGNSENGPTIIQIMGSWCPNCMDETRYFKQLYGKYAESGLNIIGITFERKADLAESQAAIDKMVRDLDIPYPVLFGGKASGDAVAAVLPMIDNFMSYPTSIFIDKNGVVRNIHTGFSGQGTSAFEPYSIETEALIEEMIAE